MSNPTAAVLAIDLGTSSCKAALYSREGDRIQLASTAYGVNAPQPGFAEQDPADYVAAAQHVCWQLMDFARSSGVGIAALSFSTQTPTLVFCDADLKPVCPAIIWQDSRAGEEAEWLRTHTSTEQRHTWFGMDVPLSGASAPAKLLWMRTYAPDAWRRTHFVMQPKDYVAAVLTGKAVTDAWCAKGLAHVESGSVNPHFRELLGTPEPLSPPVLDSAAACGRVTPEAATEWRIPAGTPVTVGWSDALAAILSTGAFTRERTAFVITGTSEIVGMSRRGGPAHPGLFRVPPRLTGGGTLEVHFGPTQAGGSAVDWAARLMGKTTQDLLDLLPERPAPSPILFRPHLAGERAPFWDHSLTASLEGLRLEHGPADVTLAIVQGIALHERLLLACADDATRPSHVVLAGGAARHDRWNQIRANILQRAVFAMDDLEASLRGAALLGWAGLGDFDLRNPPASWLTTRRIEPAPEWARPAEKLMDRYVQP